LLLTGKILDGSPAGRCEQLQVGDSILAINSIDIANMTHQEIVNFIKASGLSIVLTVSPVTNSGGPSLFSSDLALQDRCFVDMMLSPEVQFYLLKASY